jgi:hypothetical protein
MYYQERKPIWKTQDGQVFYNIKDITTVHMENIVDFLHKKEVETLDVAKRKAEWYNKQRSLFIKELAQRELMNISPDDDINSDFPFGDAEF